MESTGAKRVRFSEPHPPKTERKRATVLPDVEDEEDERQYEAAHCGPIKDLDPEAAAKRRAARRQEASAAPAGGGSVGHAAAFIPLELEEAEEEDPEVMVGYNEAGQPIPIEPFNLVRERDEGYFDADGNYIEFRLSDISDAWLEGLDELQRQQSIKIDNMDAAELLRMAGASGGGSKRQDLEVAAAKLDAEDQAVYKSRIAGMLRPGETVLVALRRLANMHLRPQPGHHHHRASAAGGGDHPQTGAGEGRRGSRGKRRRGRGRDDDAMSDGPPRLDGGGPLRGGGDDDDDDGESNVHTLSQQGQSGERQRLRKLTRKGLETASAEVPLAVHAGTFVSEGGCADIRPQATLKSSRGVAGHSPDDADVDAPAVQQSRRSSGSSQLSMGALAEPSDVAMAAPSSSVTPPKALLSSPPGVTAGGSIRLSGIASPPRETSSSGAAGSGSLRGRKDPPSSSPAAAAAAGREAPPPSSSSSQVATRSPAGGAPGSSRRGPDRRVPLENSVEFDKLTGYADLLLGQSEHDIYTKTKEQLEREVVAAERRFGSSADGLGEASLAIGNGGGSSLGSSSAVSAAAALVASLTRDIIVSDAPAPGPGDPSAPSPWGASLISQQPSAAGVPAGLPPLLDDPAYISAVKNGVEVDDDDMFGDKFDLHTVQPPSARPGSSDGSRSLDPAEASTAGEASTAETAGNPSQGRGAEEHAVWPSEGGGIGEAAADGSNGGVAQDYHIDSVEDAGGDEGPMQGFELDADSGMLYNSSLGFFYDPNTGLWRDAASGRWFRQSSEGGQFVDVATSEVPGEDGAPQ